MNDPQIFEAFLVTAGVPNPRSRLNIINGLADTFTNLFHITDKDIHYGNLIPNRQCTFNRAHSTALQAMRFELQNRFYCDALPTDVELAAIDNVAINLMKTQMIEFRTAQTHRENSNKPTMEVQKLKSTNWYEFKKDVVEALGRVYGVNGVPLTYLVRDDDAGDYNAQYVTIMHRLTACSRLTGPNYAKDNETLYTLLVQYVGDSTGMNTIEAFESTRDGRGCWKALLTHHENNTYRQNLAAKANSSLRSVFYNGEKRNFTFDKYYQIMTQAFNELDRAGNDHGLTEAQKIRRFEDNLLDLKAQEYSVNIHAELLAGPANQLTFESYYNQLRSKLKALQILTANSSARENNNRGNLQRTIGQTSFSSSHGGGRGNSGGRGRGQGRGRGRGGRGHNGRGSHGRGSHSFVPYTGPRLEARMYPSHEWKAFSRNQRAVVNHMKQEAGWIDTQTPPQGFTINHLGYAVQSANVARAQFMPPAPIGPVPPPPPPRTPAPVPAPEGILTNISVNAGSVGNAFGGRQNIQRADDNASIGQASISSVSVNGRPYNGPVYNAQGNRIN